MCYFPNSYTYLPFWISYLHMQLMSKFTSFYKKFQSLSQDHLIIIHNLFGSSSTSLSAHQIHKMLPANPLLDSGISNPSIHVTLLILSKGVLYARNSRFVSDKLELVLLIPVMGQVEVVEKLIMSEASQVIQSYALSFHLGI